MQCSAEAAGPGAVDMWLPSLGDIEVLRSAELSVTVPPFVLEQKGDEQQEFYEEGFQCKYITGGEGKGKGKGGGQPSS